MQKRGTLDTTVLDATKQKARYELRRDRARLHLTQRGLRETINDLMRAAPVKPIVTRSISGHRTERLHGPYSTVRGAEQRDSIRAFAPCAGSMDLPLEERARIRIGRREQVFGSYVSNRHAEDAALAVVVSELVDSSTGQSR